MTRLADYLGTRVRLRVWPLSIDETGTLDRVTNLFGTEGEWLTISTLPAVHIPIEGMVGYARGTALPEPGEMADYSLADDERLIQIWPSGSPARS